MKEYKFTVPVGVSGGTLPKEFSVKINVEFDYTDYVIEDNADQTAENFLGILKMASSPRVQLQNGTLRKCTTEVLEGLVKTGYKCKVSDIVTGKVRTPVNPMKEAIKASEKMDKAQIEEMIKMLQEKLTA